MAYFQSSGMAGGTQHEAQLRLYLHQNVSGPDVNQTKICPNMYILDWPIREGRDPGSKVVARAQGTQAISGRTMDSFILVFEADDYLKGSTLVVRGAGDKDPFEYAIVGGTKQFTLAQGIVSGKLQCNTNHGAIWELVIHVFYRPIERSGM